MIHISCMHLKMASMVFVTQWLLALFFCFNLAKSEMGIAGTGMGYLPEPGGGVAVTGGSGGHDEPEDVVVKALQCFSSEKHIYRGCEESYRLTESGQIHVPLEYIDEYCSGSCLQETRLVLNCVDNIFSHFIFYNHATIKDVEKTIKIGCSYGPHRGDFNVAEHIKGDESSSYLITRFALPPVFLVFVHFIFGFSV